MNQIAYEAGKRKTKRNTPGSGKVETRKGIKIFAITIIIFGIVLLSEGAYAMVTRSGKEADSNSPIPDVTMEQLGQNIEIKIKHTRPIDTIKYSWNNGAETVLHGKGRMEITELIAVEEGSNNLFTLIIQDSIGVIVTKTASFSEAGSDGMRPEINLEQDGDRIKITVQDNKELDRMEYYWNEEDPIVINASATNPKTIEERIEIVKGTNKLTITAYDKEGNRSELSKTIKTANNPKVTLELVEGTKGTYLIKVVASSNVAEVRVEEGEQIVSTNEEGVAKPDLGEKTVEFEYSFPEGSHNVKIVAVDVNGLQDEVEQTIEVHF